MNVFAGGILGYDGETYFRDSSLTSIPYNKDNEKNEEVWKYRATWDSEIHLSVEVWQDKMLPADFDLYQKGFQKLKKKYPQMTETDFTSAVKARTMAKKWIDQMSILANKWFEKTTDKAKIQAKLKGLSFSKINFFDGQVQCKVSMDLP